MAAASYWELTTASSTGFESQLTGETWNIYRSGGTGSSTTLSTEDDVPVLRLTATDVDTTGVVINSKSYAVSSGLDIRFTMAQWGTASGADGICCFLLDAAATVSVPGAAGGGLGYSGGDWNAVAGRFDGRPGLPGGLLGVGFDNFGNFGAQDFGPKADGESFTFYDTPGFQARPWLAIRGRRDTDYALVSAVDRGTSGDGGTKDFWAGTTFANGSTRCRITVTSAGLVTVYAGDQGDTSTAWTSLTQIDQVTVSGLFTDVTNVRFGFSAATGGQVNNHAVREDVSVTALA